MTPQAAKCILHAWGPPGLLEVKHQRSFLFHSSRDDKDYWADSARLRARIQELFVYGGRGHKMGYRELIDREISWSELNCCLDGLPRGGPHHYLTVQQLMAAWLRCWAMMDHSSQSWDLPRNEQMETALRFEILTVPDLGQIWKSGEADCDDDRADLKHQRCFGLKQKRQPGDGWRVPPVADLDNYRRIVESMKAQNLQATQATWRFPGATGRSQPEKEAVYRDRRLAAKFLREHGMGADPDEPLQGLVEFFDRHDNSSVRLLEAQELAEGDSFRTSLGEALVMQGIVESPDRRNIFNVSGGFPLSASAPWSLSVGGPGHHDSFSNGIEETEVSNKSGGDEDQIEATGKTGKRGEK